jgi:hypothetical protein
MKLFGRRRRKGQRAAMPAHPVTVRVSLSTGAVVLQGKDVQLDAIANELARAGVELDVSSRGLCG